MNHTFFSPRVPFCFTSMRNLFLLLHVLQCTVRARLKAHHLDTVSRRGDDTRRYVSSALRRAVFGVAVVIAASAILLVSDLQHRERARARTANNKWKLYFVQYNDVIDVKDAQAGVLEGLRE